MLERRLLVSSTRAVRLLTLALCAASLAGCKKKPPAPLPEPQAEDEIVAQAPALEPTAAPSAGPVRSRCHELAGKSFTIGEIAKERTPAEDEDDAGPDQDDEVPAPYSVELGAARVDSGGFVLGALRSKKGETHALIALLPADAASGKVVDLGVVHGDPDPPAFAIHGADVVVAASDTDAGGGMLRLGLVRDARASAQTSWGQEITGVRRDSTFALEVAGDKALLVYASEVSGKIRVFGALLDPANLKNKLSPEPLSAAGADVDSPRLALRKGGYWLAVARSLDAPKKPAKKPSDAGSELGEDESLLDIGTRRIEVTKLDAQGKSASSALVVSAPGAHPMTFDLAAAPDGGAYVSYRDDDSTPGTDGGPLSLVHVKLDGTFEKLELNADASGTGAPSLLIDASDSSKVWLSAAGENGATCFGRIGEHTTLAPDSSVRGADLIAVQGGQFLLARSKSTAAELSVAACGE
ncbi:MAG TPA: hypothetical protein VHV51_25610 [Polyangiaceae bacterium]|jgi:hypothetical protein|nr:hypothetical protein [Polyangiaceae bacterium]